MPILPSRKRLPGLFFAAFVAIAPAFGAGCGGSKATIVASPYNSAELEIQIQEIKLDDEKLKLKLMFVNHTTSVMQVDRNQLKLAARGQLQMRFTGTFGGMTPAIHAIPAGLSHAVFVDYIVGEGFSGTAALALSQGGVIVNGAALQVPDLVFTVTPNE